MIQQQRRPPPRIALASMPWAHPSRPNIALGVIKAQLGESGIETEITYPCIELARELGFEVYDHLAGRAIWPFLGEWLCSKAAFKSAAEGEGPGSVEAWIPDDAVAECLQRLLGDHFAERLSVLREQVLPAYCEQLAERFAERAVLGFTCSFNQLVSSLAVARAVKDRNPEVRVLLGGPQVGGDAGREILRALPWVDAVYDGEFEVGGVKTMLWALGERDTPPVEYVSYRDREGALRLSTDTALLQDMDRSPTPDYDEYFRAAEGARDLTGNPLQVGPLPFESSRGCWWGQRQHCTFCGLNGSAMPFRSKSVERVLNEVLVLAGRYHQVALAAVDNIIDHKYVRTLLPRLKDLNLGIELFYETKANLERRDVRSYQQAGLSVIQPGIESLSSHVLALMRKGISAIRNVYLLKLCRQYGISPLYNILLGFPGEAVEDHVLQAEWMERIHHLSPPSEVCRFGLQRHSPMHDEWESFGLENVRPAEGYRFIFPAKTIDLEKIAFYFDYDLSAPPELTRARRKVARAVRRWKKRWHKGIREPELIYRNAGEFVLVIDGRSTQTPCKHVLTELSKDVLLACDDPITLQKLRRHVGDASDLEATIDGLVEFGLVLREGHLLLGLAIPHSKRARLPFEPSVLPGGKSGRVWDRPPSAPGNRAAVEVTTSRA